MLCQLNKGDSQVEIGYLDMLHVVENLVSDSLTIKGSSSSSPSRSSRSLQFGSASGPLIRAVSREAVTCSAYLNKIASSGMSEYVLRILRTWLIGVMATTQQHSLSRMWSGKRVIHEVKCSV